MRWARLMWIAASTAAIAAACSSFDEPPSVEGANDGGADGTSDTGTTSEGGADVDAEADADAARDAGSCSPKPTNCVGGSLYELDFTSDAMPPNLFLPVTSNGALSHVANDGHCAPGLAHATGTVPNGGRAEAWFYTNDNSQVAYKSGRLVYSFRGPNVVTDSYVNIGCNLLFRPTSPSNAMSSIILAMADNNLTLFGSVRGTDGGKISFADGSVALDNTVSETEATSWRTLDARFVIGQTSVAVSGTLDGVAFTPFDVPLVEPAVRFSLECGITFADRAPVKHDFDLDDILVELCP